LGSKSSKGSGVVRLLYQLNRAHPHSPTPGLSAFFPSFRARSDLCSDGRASPVAPFGFLPSPGDDDSLPFPVASRQDPRPPRLSPLHHGRCATTRLMTKLNVRNGLKSLRTRSSSRPFSYVCKVFSPPSQARSRHYQHDAPHGVMGTCLTWK